MANTYVNKVVKSNGDTIIDLTDATASADKILQGYTAYGADGSKLVGTATGGGGGTDIPVFTATIGQSGDLTNISCDRTFAEVLDYLDTGMLLVLVEIDFGGETETYGARMYGVGDDVIFSLNAGLGGLPVGEITMASTGVCTWSSPSSATTTLTATQNGTYSDSRGRAYTEVTVSVPSGSPSLQSKTKSYTPTETAQSETVTADSGYDGLSSVAVSVSAVSPTYVGSNITRRASADLTASGATVTAPAGYYDTAATKTIAAGSASTPSTTITANPSISVGSDGLITATTSASENVTPSVTAGYVSSGTPGTVSVSGSNTQQLSTQAAATITPTESEQTAVAAGKYTTGAVTVAAIPSQYIVPSGTYNVTGSGTKDVTNYASASVPAMTLPSSTSTTSSGTQKAYILPGSSRRYINIPTGFNDSAQYYDIAPIDVTTLEVTENGTYSASDPQYDVDGFSSVTVNVSGGGSVTQTDWINAQSSTTSSTITYTGLKGEPTSFAITVDDDLATGSPAKVAAVVFDGTTLHGQTVTNTSNAQASYDTGFTKSYSNGTLTVTAANAQFQSLDYGLAYTYGGSAGDVYSEDVQVGSGATSITFTGLEDEPIWWNCIFKSNFGTSSGYQRVMYVSENSSGGNVFGMCLDSSGHTNIYWTATYSNGSLAISSQGTNAGGYFHQPGYYQLTYAVAGGGGNYQSKTVTPTASQQVVEADSGYDALKKVTVNAIPSTYVQPSSTVGATTYRASTSSQTIAAGTYHSEAATIAAVSQTNLTAANIKSGTTVTISNGQSNIWSVLGTYTGSGGGSSMNVQVAQSTTRATTSTYTSLVSLTCSKAGTYEIFWDCFRSSTGGTTGSQLYIADEAYGTANTTFTNHIQTNHLTGVALAANQTVAVYARSRGSNYYAYVGTLVIKQTA